MAHLNAQRDTNLGTLITHAAASAGVSTAALDTYQGRGLLVFVNVTALTGTSPTLTVTVKGSIDDKLTATYTILASAAISATGLTVLRIYPALTVSANAVANDVVPVFTQITTAIGGTGPAVTATISAVLLY
jgi:hypothetical protein